MYFLIICRVSIDPLAHINDFGDFIYKRIGNYSIFSKYFWCTCVIYIANNKQFDYGHYFQNIKMAQTKKIFYQLYYLISNFNSKEVYCYSLIFLKTKSLKMMLNPRKGFEDIVILTFVGPRTGLATKNLLSST